MGIVLNFDENRKFTLATFKIFFLIYFKTVNVRKQFVPWYSIQKQWGDLKKRKNGRAEIGCNGPRNLIFCAFYKFSLIKRENFLVYCALFAHA